MIREIVKDTFFLSQKSELATRQDLPVVQDLLIIQNSATRPKKAVCR